MRAILGLVGTLALAGCPLQTQKSMTLGSSSSSSSPSPSPSSSSSPSVGSSADEERERAAEWHGQQGQSNLDAANFLRAEFEALTGLSIAKAKAQAKARGHTGEVEIVEERDYIASCKDGTVCSATDQGGGQTGMSNSDTLQLHINKKLSIAPPPD